MASLPAETDETAVGLPISVCVPAMRADTIPATIQAIRAQTWTDWELIVLGQGARSGLEAAVARGAGGDRRVRYLHLDRAGLSHARNAALSAASGSVIAFTDDDCEPRQDWLATIARGFLTDPRLGLLGGAVLSPMARGRLTTCPTVSPSETLYDPMTDVERPPRWDWMGANFAVRREVASSLGMFDECLGAGADFPAAEDTDYKFRLEAAGVRMLATPRSAVVHTYGVRRGWAMFRSQRNYATGNGGMAGKLTLLGDRRGAQWLEDTRAACFDGGRLAPHRLARGVRRLHYFSSAYRHCLRDYTVDADGMLLRR